MGIYTLGELAAADVKTLNKHLGINGVRMQRCAAGLDGEPVKKADFERVIKSVGHGTTTLRDMTSVEDAEKVIFYLSEMVATRLRRYGMRATAVQLDLRCNDLSHRTRQSAIRPTFTAFDVYTCAKALLSDIWKGNKDISLRSLTVAACNLTAVSESVQASIFDKNDDKAERLEFSLDGIRKKFGFKAIQRASLLENDLVDDKFFGEEDLLPFKR